MSNPNFLAVMREKTTERLKKIKLEAQFLRDEAEKSARPANFLDIFSRGQIEKLPACVITEIKFASPSLGQITQEQDYLKIAKQYLEQGSSALSVLTESEYFKGSLDYLKNIRQVFPRARLLMKDFIQDEVQLFQARLAGANAILLITDFLSPAQLQELYSIALELSLTPFIETHTQEQVESAQAMGASLIGVNNRNLSTLKTDLATSKKMQIKQDEKTFFISESGITSGYEIDELMQLGYHGFLIGGHLMTAHHPGEALKKLFHEVIDARQNMRCD